MGSIDQALFVLVPGTLESSRADSLLVLLFVLLLLDLFPQLKLILDLLQELCLVGNHIKVQLEVRQRLILLYQHPVKDLVVYEAKLLDLLTHHCLVVYVPGLFVER